MFIAIKWLGLFLFVGLGIAGTRADDVGRPAPLWTLSDLDAHPVRLADQSGKVVVLSFWATWCPDCLIEAPVLSEFQKEEEGKDVAVIGIAVDRDIGAVRKFIAARGISYRIVLGDDLTRFAYGNVAAYPTTFVIDRAGKIVKRYGDTEKVTVAGLREVVDPLLSSTPVEKAEAAPALEAISGPISASGAGSPEAAPSGETTISHGGFYRKFSGGTASSHYTPELARENYFVYVPDGYDGSRPFGLIAFLNAGDAMELPAGWEKVLAEKNLLYLAAQKIGNGQNIGRRMSVTMDGVVQMEKAYRIDPARVYLSGVSGGARAAICTAFHYPDFFAGIVPICGADYFRAVPKVAATKDDAYGVSQYDDFLVPIAKRKMRIALVTGENDWRRGNILDIYNGAYLKDGFQVKLWDVPGMGHEICGPQVLAEAVAFLDDRKAPDTAASAP